MSSIKLGADSGGGTVALKGPASTTGNAAVQLTLPVDDGTTGQYLKTDGSGALSWATVSSTPEGTAIQSTGESGGSKFLREDGDGTCSWQTVSTTPADNSITGAKIAMGSDAAGDLLYYNGTDYARLAKGNNGETLESGATPIWKKRGRAIGFDAGYNTGGSSVTNSYIGTSWVEMAGASTATYVPKETDSILHVRIAPTIFMYNRGSNNWEQFRGYFYYKHQTTGNTSWTQVSGTEGNIRSLGMFDHSSQTHGFWDNRRQPCEMEYDHSVTAGEWIQFTIYWRGAHTADNYDASWNQDSNNQGPMRWSITEYSTRT